MMAKRYTQIDQETGEEIGSFVAIIRPKQKSFFGRHMTFNQDMFLHIANRLNHEQTRVLMVLFYRLDFENYICIPQSEIAQELGIQQPHVSRALKGLLTEEIITPGPKVGQIKSYKLNPHYGWKGSVTNHNKALKHGLSVIDGGKA